MNRELKSRDEIQAEVHRLIHLDPKVIEDGVQIEIPMAMETDPYEGCNWAMTGYRNADKYMDAVTLAVNQVQAKWNLRC